MTIESSFNVPRIKCRTIEQGAYAFALRESYLRLNQSIDECMRVIGEYFGEEDLPWQYVFREDVYGCYFDERAESIINAIKRKYKVGIIDLRFLGYDEKNKDYDRYVEDFGKCSCLYEIEDEEQERMNVG